MELTKQSLKKVKQKAFDILSKRVDTMVKKK